MLNILDTIWGFIELAREFFSWRDDWNRSWSPVSFWLAVVVGITILGCIILFGSRAWDHLRVLIWASS